MDLRFTIISIIVTILIFLFVFKKKPSAIRAVLAAIGGIVSITTITIAAIFAFLNRDIFRVLLSDLTGKIIPNVEDSYTTPWWAIVLPIIFSSFSIYMLVAALKNVNTNKPSNQETNPVLGQAIFSKIYHWLQSLFIKNKLQPVDPEKHYIDYVTPIDSREPLEDTLSGNESWNQRAKELIYLHHRFSYRLEQWHENQKCWIGYHQWTKAKIAVLCVINEPKLAEVRAFIEYTTTLGLEADTKYRLILIKTRKTKKLNGKISQLTEHELLTTLVDFEEYYNHIVKRVEDTKLPDSEITIQDCYVASPLKNINKHLEEYVFTWLDESSRRHIAVLGEYGQGKSTGSLLITYKIIQKIIKKEKVLFIPILMELRSKSPANAKPLELLSAWGSIYGYDARALELLLKAGKLFIIFEGFDEMFGIDTLEMRRRHFETLWQFTYFHSKIMFTGRPNLFLDDKELKRNLGIQDTKGMEGAYCTEVYLNHFDIDKIHESLRWKEQVIQQEIVNLAKNTNFYDIASRPSLLYLIGVIWESEREQLLNKNINPARVIKIFIEHSYRRQTEKAVQEHQNFMPLREVERAYFMERIALYMFKYNQLQNQMPMELFHQVIEILYTTIPENILEEHNVPHDKLPTIPLKKRYEGLDLKTQLEKINTDLRTYGILNKDPSKQDVKFAHKSFFEFLVAKMIAYHIAEPENLDSYSIVSDIYNIYWSEEILTYIEELLPDNCSSNFLKKSLSFIPDFIHMLSPIDLGFNNNFIINKINIAILLGQPLQVSNRFLIKNYQRVLLRKIPWERLHRMNFKNAILERANLEGVNLEGANLKDANLEGANLERANLKDAKLWGAKLQEINLKGANLGGVNLQEINLKGAKLWRAKLQGSNLQRADLRGSDLRGADLGGADLGGADLRGADLRGAKLQNTDLQFANLEDANLEGASLERANLQNANLQRAKLRSADLRGTCLRDTNLQGADLGGADLGGADLRGADLGGADLRGADLRGAKLQNTDLQFANLEDANLEGASLERANLQNANLQRAKLQGMFLFKTNLQGAKLRSADLRGACLRDTNLQGADLGEADLGEADLEGANLEDAKLQSADLREANLEGANLEDAKLQSADLREANLEGANLQGANLRRADLKEADLRRADLKEADLLGIYLLRANLEGADLGGANLEGADLQGTDLSQSLYLYQALNLKLAKNLDQAILPKDFTLPD